MRRRKRVSVMDVQPYLYEFIFSALMESSH
jgi:hypothetical protein